MTASRPTGRVVLSASIPKSAVLQYSVSSSSVGDGFSAMSLSGGQNSRQRDVSSLSGCRKSSVKKRAEDVCAQLQPGSSSHSKCSGPILLVLVKSHAMVAATLYGLNCRSPLRATVKASSIERRYVGCSSTS